MTSLTIVIVYLVILLTLAIGSSRLFRGTSTDFFIASRSIGPFVLLMSIFGTTMTAFALVGSTGKAFQRGVGVYGLMASSSGLIHAACFFLIGVKLWALGKRYGYVTQIQFFRDRFQSNGLGYLLFPILVGLVIPYLLIGVVGAGKVIGPMTKGLFPVAFEATGGSIPPSVVGLVICGVVLTYVFLGGSRAAAWANTFQTLVFMVMGVVAFFLIANQLGGLSEAIKAANPAHLVRTPSELEIASKSGSFMREVGVPPMMFLSYMFIPLSVGMFPHLFQNWLTARSAQSFKLTLVAHPLCILVVWVPCVLIGLWATAAFAPGHAAIWDQMPLKLLQGLPDQSVGASLSIMVKGLVQNPVVVGLVTAGILAAIMSSMDSQFLCLGTIFTNDIVLHNTDKDRFTDRQILWIARGFIIVIVFLTYLLSLWNPVNVFDLAVWCFSGFASLTPLVFAAIYWKRATATGAVVSVIAAMGTWLFCFWKSGFGGEYTLDGIAEGLMPVSVCVIAGVLGMIIGSFLSKPMNPVHVQRFFPPCRKK